MGYVFSGERVGLHSGIYKQVDFFRGNYSKPKDAENTNHGEVNAVGLFNYKGIFKLSLMEIWMIFLPSIIQKLYFLQR
jgi:hypothetical protein